MYSNGLGIIVAGGRRSGEGRTPTPTPGGTTTTTPITGEPGTKLGSPKRTLSPAGAPAAAGGAPAKNGGGGLPPAPVEGMPSWVWLAGGAGLLLFFLKRK